MPIAPGSTIGPYEIQAPLGEGGVLGLDGTKRRHMSSTTRVTVLAILLVLPAQLIGQSDDEVPRLPWGSPDLQGIWLYGTSTSLERPEEFGDKAVVTAEEAADFVARRQDEGVTSGDWDLYTGLLNGRTSLLIDPPNGRLPSRTAAGQRRWDTIGLPNPDRVRKADGPGRSGTLGNGASWDVQFHSLRA